MTPSLLLSAVDWDVLCPWLLLRKSLKNAFTFRLLFLTTIHILLVSLWLAAAFGWFASPSTVSDFLKEYSPISAYVPHAVPVNANLALETELVQAEQPLPGMNVTQPSPLALLMEEAEAKAEQQIEQLPPKTGPALSWTGILNRVVAVIYAFFSTLLLWLFVARRMAIHVTRGLNVSFGQIFHQVKNLIPSILSAYAFLLLGLAILALPLLLLRWLAGLTAGEVFCPGFLTFFGLIYSTFFFFFLLGAGIGGLFIPSVLVTEYSDAFDALSRSFSYALQRPLRFVFYLFVAAFFGLLGLVAMIAFTVGILYFYRFSLGIGMVTNPASSMLLYAFSWAVSAYFFLFSASTVEGIYLLLRRDVDAVELETIWLPDPQGIPAPKLPDLKGGAETH